MNKTIMCATAIIILTGFIIARPSQIRAGMEGMEGSHGMMSNMDKSEEAINGYCPVCVASGKLMKGNDDFITTYNGVKYKFPGLKQQKVFLNNPEKYVNNLEYKYQILKNKARKKR